MEGNLLMSKKLEKKWDTGKLQPIEDRCESGLHVYTVPTSLAVRHMGPSASERPYLGLQSAKRILFLACKLAA